MQRASVGWFEPLERRTLLSFGLDYALGVGNADDDDLRAVDVDEQGNTLYMGRFIGRVHLDPHPLTPAVGFGHGVGGTYLAKRDSAGNFEWGIELLPQDQGRTWGWDLAHDDSGNIYATGVITKKNSARLFISKFGPAGQQLWSRVSTARTSYTMRYPVATDASGDVLVTGAFKDALDLDGDGIVDLTSNSRSELDAFVASFSSEGQLQWARKITSDRGRGFVSPRGIAADRDGNVLTTGWFEGDVDFDPGPSQYKKELRGTYVLKLDKAGDFNWVRTVKSDDSTTIGVDAAGNTYTAGVLGWPVDFEPGPGKLILTPPFPHAQEDDWWSEVADIYISKLSPQGKLLWAIRAADSNDIIADDPKLAVTNDGNVYVTFGFDGTLDVDQRPGNCSDIRSGFFGMLLLKLDSKGNYLDAAQLGGDEVHNYFDAAQFDRFDSIAADDVAINHQGKIVLGGGFMGVVDVDPTAAVHQLSTKPNDFDSFVLRLTDATNTNELNRDSLKAQAKRLKKQIRAARKHGKDLDPLRTKLRQVRVALKAATSCP